MSLSGGADTIQFRMKKGSTREMIDIAVKMRELCGAAHVPLIVNDRVDVAIASEAHGVHLGKEDFPLHKAREILGRDMIIGGSASNVNEAIQCMKDGADYIGFGPIYPTDSKEDAGFVKGVLLLQEMVKAISIPVIAIGGVDEKNTEDVIKSGAHGVAVISSVCCRKDPENAVKKLSLSLRSAE
jgi:thiamine-phosphate pyrophosphorylase